MKKNLFFLFFFLVSMHTIIAQSEFPNYFEDYFENKIETKSSATKYASFGNIMTPKGDIRVLVICAGFEARHDTLKVNNWAEGSSTMPNWINDPSQRIFYSDTTQFENPLNIDGTKNISRFYYEMSGKKFRITADILNTRINVTDTIGYRDGEQWSYMNRKVLNKMKELYPNFDWAQYDNRKNRPSYTSDNSYSSPDKKPDFVIILYRYNPNWKSNEQPISGMNKWSGSTGGFAALSTDETVTYNGYTFDGSGYTHCFGGNDFSDLFIHEMAHGIFDCPHYSEANGITGKYFYGQHGWSMMNRSYSPFSCANGWERWWLDWIGLSASNVNTDITKASDLNTSGEYTLRDFITTGDVIRLKIPNENATNQYLWLENHKGASIFDKRTWTNDSRGIPFPASPTGIAAYIEAISDNKNNTYNFGTGANGLKFLHAKGNYDFTFDTTKIYQPNIIWGNYYYNYFEHEMNPISGQGSNEMIRGDYNLDGIIIQDIGTNSQKGNEHRGILKRDGVLTFDQMGSEIVFRSGQKLSMASNPCLINRPLYNEKTQIMGTHYLNGISVEFLTASKVKIRYNDVDIDRNTRYTGFIRLPNITAGTSTPDIRIMPGITLKIDKSGTPNRHTKTTWNDFINLTEFMCSDSAYFKQEARSNVIVEDSTLLVLESGSKYEINDNARLIIRSGSTLMIKSGATLTVKGSGAIDVENGAFLCIDPAATINLTDSFSVINMKNGSALGKGILNPFSEYATPVYTTNYNSIKDTGKGSVNRFPGSNIYLQNMNITGTKYFFARDILVGRDVIPDSNPPKGSVTIKSGADIRINAEGDVLFKNDVTVEKGASVTVE